MTRVKCRNSAFKIRWCMWLANSCALNSCIV
jgi:hypothetical protein